MKSETERKWETKKRNVNQVHFHMAVKKNEIIYLEEEEEDYSFCLFCFT